LQVVLIFWGLIWCYTCCKHVFSDFSYFRVLVQCCYKFGFSGCRNMSYNSIRNCSSFFQSCNTYFVYWCPERYLHSLHCRVVEARVLSPASSHLLLCVFRYVPLFFLTDAALNYIV
jgi:hypothetical protein